jgi:pimeloyl-ACP methyl ester carboxylesterase
MTDRSSFDTQFWTPLGVRLRQVRRNPGSYNWLLFPGGPGIGSESLLGLAHTADLAGTTWLVDLPGDGSNVYPPGAPTNPYTLWPHVLLEAVDAVPAPIAVGHSTGGEYLLSVPALEERLTGLVLISSAPDSGWMPTFETMCAVSPIPETADAAEAYEANPSHHNLRRLAVTSAPWNFTPEGLASGRALLENMPYNPHAVEWSATHFDRQYISTWWPSSLPTLIISGSEDRIVDQSLWNDPHYRGPHIQQVTINAAGHFPWIEQPTAVRNALHQLLPAPATRSR